MTGLEFAQLAESKCGSDASWSRSKMGLGPNTSWSAAFVSSCAQELGVLGSVVPKSTKCQDIADNGTSSDSVTFPGEWLPGPAEGQESVPESGDVVLVTWSSNPTNRADLVGIVKSHNSSDSTVDVVFGDYGSTGSNNSKVRMITLNDNFTCIKGYFRPAWKEL